MEYFSILFGTIFVRNFVLAQFLGLCPFIGVSTKSSSAKGMGLAVIFVMTMASLVTFAVWYLLLRPGALSVDIGFLKITVFILVIACLVQIVEMVMQKFTPALYKMLGIYLPLITTNCAVLGVTEINVRDFKTASFGAGLAKSTLNGFAGGVGFMLAMMLMAALREQIDLMPIPKPFKGAPIAFVTTACMALAFLGFSGMV